MSFEVGRCNLCRGFCKPLLEIGAIPLMQNRFNATLQDAQAALTASCGFLWCDACCHVSVRKKNNPEFDENYNNSQIASQVALQHYLAVVEDIKGWLPNKNARILEIGCGRGELMEMLRAAGYGCIKGYDPAAPANIDFLINEHWSRAVSGNSVYDLLIIRHTLEEVHDPVDFVAAIVTQLAPGGYVYCEITNVSNILDVEGMFSFYSEYSNLFSINSLAEVFARNGLSIKSVSSHGRGEWLGIWAARISVPSAETTQNLVEKLSSRIAELPRPLVLWGAGGRGGNLLAIMKIRRTLIEYVVDIDPKKRGLFIPPYGQEIISPADLDQISPKTVLVSSRRYMGEISAVSPTGCCVIGIADLIKPLNINVKVEPQVNL